MKKSAYIVLFLIASDDFLAAQTTPKNVLIIENQDQSIGSVENVACKEVRLKSYYRFSATQSGKTMRTYTNPYLVCDVDYLQQPYTAGNIPPLNQS